MKSSQRPRKNEPHRVSRLLREVCYHLCGYCNKEWSHVVSPKAPLDEWRMPCTQCVLKYGIDVVAEIEKRERRVSERRNKATAFQSVESGLEEVGAEEISSDEEIRAA